GPQVLRTIESSRGHLHSHCDFNSVVDHRQIHSFPTRRSSDLSKSWQESGGLLRPEGHGGAERMTSFESSNDVILSAPPCPSGLSSPPDSCQLFERSEERRVGKECICRWSTTELKSQCE